MTDPARLREAIARTIQQHDNDHIPENYASGLSDEVSDWSAYLADKVLAALPTDAVQPVGGVDREAFARAGLWANLPADRSVGGAGPLDAFEAGKRAATDAILALYATAPTAGSGCIYGISLRGQQGEPAGTMTVTAHMSDGREVVLIEDNGNVISHWKNVRDLATAGSGWVMVPREPTEAMLDAMFAGYCGSDGSYRAAYRAMITAAPTVGSE